MRVPDSTMHTESTYDNLLHAWWQQSWHHGVSRFSTMTSRRLSAFGNTSVALYWRHNGHDGVSNHQPHGCLLNRLFRCRSKKTSKLRVTGLCMGNSPVTGEFPAQRASNAENVSIWWRHHGNPGRNAASSPHSSHSMYFGCDNPGLARWRLNVLILNPSHWRRGLHLRCRPLGHWNLLIIISNVTDNPYQTPRRSLGQPGHLSKSSSGENPTRTLSTWLTPVY